MPELNHRFVVAGETSRAELEDLRQAGHDRLRVEESVERKERNGKNVSYQEDSQGRGEMGKNYSLFCYS